MKKITTITGIIVLLTTLVTGCKSSESVAQQETAVNTGNFVLVANGEDFVRQGFVAKDGWQIEFDRLEVSVSEVIAYELNADDKSDLENNLKSAPQVLILNQSTTI
ncbi:hypothetical protein [Xenococcus sp. PCC 7305]|uniref:hypothetical protein n=1 Tax=Xenococcus sp. PCC 7305 TaxID=102125 RepID=UPI000308FE13|nr:hypothetical protein [Xenococcus sp. PCC 7305]